MDSQFRGVICLRLEEATHLCNGGSSRRGCGLSYAETGTPCGGSQVSTNGWVQAHRMLVPWNEAQATRDVRLTGVNWSAPYGAIDGTDALATMESTVQVKQNETGTWKSWTLTNAVQYWLADPNTNYGVILWTPDENLDGYDMRFRSSEHTNKPKLEVVWSNQPKTVYFLKDHLGSVRATVDQTGAVVGYDDYDPWGYILENRTKTRTWGDNQAIAENKFTGKERDEEFSLNWDFFGARYYDAEIGRWMVRDPRMSEYPNLSPYVYVVNNPLILVDPDGEKVTFTAKAGSPNRLVGVGYGGHFDDKENYIRVYEGYAKLAPEQNTEQEGTRLIDGDTDFFTVVDGDGNPVLKDKDGSPIWIKVGDEKNADVTIDETGEVKDDSSLLHKFKQWIGLTYVGPAKTRDEAKRADDAKQVQEEKLRQEEQQQQQKDEEEKQNGQGS